jgi:rhodanese-related sulfurtransferase
VAASLSWISWKLLQKYRFRKLSALLHITIDELLELLGQQSPPLILDLRGQGLAAQTQAIPGATVADYEGLLEVVNAWPREHPIVTLCACPEDATAIQAAQKLLKAGFTSVRPLKGGYQAWADATFNKDA